MKSGTRHRSILWAFSVVMLLVAGCGDDSAPTGATGSATSGGAKTGPPVVVGSANFPESQVLAEVYAGALQAKGYTVQKKLNIGSREVYFAALEKGEINFFPEYAATVLEFVNKGAGEATSDADATVKKLNERLAPKNLTAFTASPAQDQNGFAVTKATADREGFKKISDLQPKAANLVLGGPPECPTRKFCALGLQDVYGIKFKEFKPLDSGGALTVAALEGGQIDVALLFTSSGAVVAKNFVLLEDDKKLQLADNVVPVVGKNVADAYGKDFKDLVDSVSKKMTTPELIKLNKLIEIDKADAAKVAQDWLKANGFA